MSPEIVRVGPDHELFAAWCRAYAVADRFGREETAATWQPSELAVVIGKPTSGAEERAYAAVLDGEVVGAGWLRLSLLDNRHRAEIQVGVVPDRRRRGIGTALLGHLAQVARAQDRTVLGAEVAWPLDRGTAGGMRQDPGSPGVAFAWARGFAMVLDDVQRTLWLPIADDRLAELAAVAAQRHASYRLRSWSGRIPDELIAGWTALEASLDTEAPTGGLDVEERAVDVAAERQEEARREAMGRESVHSVALDADGQVVAYSHLVLPRAEPGRAYQWGTLVHRRHRGHRLGLAVKVANLQRLQVEWPDIDRIVTYNADVNSHMNAVNELLGFVATERLGEFQRTLA